MLRYCEQVTQHDELYNFVWYSCQATPGLSTIHDKCLKRKRKLERLVEKTGYWGPILDLAIRGTVHLMLSRHFGQDVKNVVLNPVLQLLMDTFRDEDLIITTKLWFKNTCYVKDYVIAYRCRRSEIISSQISFLTLNPSNIVSCY